MHFFNPNFFNTLFITPFLNTLLIYDARNKSFVFMYFRENKSISSFWIDFITIIVLFEPAEWELLIEKLVFSVFFLEFV